VFVYESSLTNSRVMDYLR